MDACAKESPWLCPLSRSTHNNLLTTHRARNHRAISPQWALLLLKHWSQASSPAKPFDLLSDSDLQINLCRTCRNIFHRLNKYNSFLNKYRKGVLSIETLVQVLHSQEALTCSYLISISRYISVRLSGDTKGTTWVEAEILMCSADKSVKTFVNYEMLCHILFALVPYMQSLSIAAPFKP